MKIYNKRGNLNYKERRLVTQITEAIEKKMATNPSLNIQPANTMAELEKLYHEHCTEEVAFTEIPGNKNEPTITKEGETGNIEADHKAFRDSVGETAEKTEIDTSDNGGGKVDPFNRDQPIVRDYVKGSDFPGEKTDNSNNQKSFGEPQTSFDQMQMPDDSASNDSKDSGKTDNKAKSNDTNQSNQSTPTTQSNNNTNNSDITDAEQRKNSKKLAESITNVVCALYSMGIVWWATKDVVAPKLEELHASNEIDLDVILSLTEDQEVSARDFFKGYCDQIKSLSKISKDDQKRMAEALANILIKKKISPTDEQMGLIVWGEVLGLNALQIVALKSTISGVVDQLKEQNAILRGQTHPGTAQSSRGTGADNYNEHTTEVHKHTTTTNHTTTEVDETIKEPVGEQNLSLLKTE